MKKKWIYIIIAFIAVIGVSALTVKIVSSAANGPTGCYDGGRIGREFLFHNGTLYIYEFRYREDLPTYAREVGKIKKVDNNSIPQEEMVATRLEVGMSVFSIEAFGSKNLLVKINDSRFEVFTPFEGDLADWQ